MEIKIDLDTESLKRDLGISELITSVNSFQSAIKEKDEQISNLKNEVAELNDAKNTAEAQSENLKRSIEEKDNEIHRVIEQLQKKDESLVVVQNEKKELSTELQELHGVRDSLKEAEERCEVLEKNISEKDNEIKELQSFRNAFDLSGLYNQLGEQTKEDLKTYFPSSDNEILLFCSIQKSSVENLYSMIKDRVINKREEDLAVLKSLLRKVYSFYCKGTGCSLIEPEIGQDSDDDLFQEKFTNEVDGKVSEVHLFGIRNADGSVKQKALVSLCK